MGKFNEFEVLYEKKGSGRGPRKTVRFAFTHQLYEPMDDKIKGRFVEVILGAIPQDSPPPACKAPVTRQHLVRRLGPIAGRVDEVEAKAVACLRPIAGRVSVERIFLSMGSVVTVCTIDPGEISTAHAAAMGWVKAIMAEGDTPHANGPGGGAAGAGGGGGHG